MELKSSHQDIRLNQTDDILSDLQGIIESARSSAYQAVNVALVRRNWLIGYRISFEGIEDSRAAYGAGIIAGLSQKLTEQFGKGFDKSSLYKYFRFYQCFPEIVDSVCPQFHLPIM